MRFRCGTIPLTSTRPALGVRMPVSILIVVDFPAPFGPSKASSSPASTRSVTPSTAVLATRSGATSALSPPRIPGLRTVVRKTLVSPSAMIVPAGMRALLGIVADQPAVLNDSS